MQPILLVLGTRPEAIKLAPVYYALKKRGLPVQVVATYQHRELLQEMLDLFEITPDHILDTMRPGQTIAHVTQSVLTGMHELYAKIQPAVVVVQGDTTTTFSAALAAFYVQIPVVHVEAGLRTYNLHAPFPEEFNRQATSLITALHCAPTTRAAEALKAEGVHPNAIVVTGNTVVDAVHLMQDKLATGAVQPSPTIKKLVEESAGKQLMLMTMHRRESFADGGIQRVVKTMQEFIQMNPSVQVLFPVHPNPQVRAAIDSVGLRTTSGITLLDPIGYVDCMYLLQHCSLVITDSGGLQEEAVSVGTPVLVTRDLSERMEGVDAGLAQLVGTDPTRLRTALEQLVHSQADREPALVYGDGTAGDQIALLIEEKFYENAQCTRSWLHRSPNGTHRDTRGV